jgi:S1-C subfamily serine protease
MRRYYQILGVSPTAAPEEIREAWLFSLKAFHPDKFASSPREQRAIADARTRAINEAYRILSDPVSRAVYDRDYFRETSYETSRPKSTANGEPLPSAEQTRKHKPTKHWLSAFLPVTPRKRVLFAAIIAGLAIVAIFAVTRINKAPGIKEPPFTRIIIPALIPTPTPFPAATPGISQPQQPVVFDLPRLAGVTRKAVGLVLGFDEKGKIIQTGSGFFISEDGRFVTNEHVIKGAKKMGVKMENGAHYTVEKISVASTRFDLVILQVHAKEVPFLKLETSGLPEVGTRIAVIGSPVSLEGTLSDGIVSAIRTGDGGTWIQITAPISPGSSGSPVLNAEGRVLGIVTLGSNGRIQNLNFARSVFDLIALDSRLSDLSRITAKETPLALSRPDASASPSASPSPPALALAESPTPPAMLLPSPTPTPSAPQASPEPQRTYRVVGLPRNHRFLNIRAGPGANFVVVGAFTAKGRGIILGPGRVTNDKTEWQEIFSGKIRGWVNAQYLEAETPEHRPGGGHN